MRCILCFSLLVIVLQTGCSKKESEPDFFATDLNTVQHEKFSFAELRSAKAVVIIFLQPECPFCNSYAKTFRRLDSTFQEADIVMLGVVSGKNYAGSEITEYSTKNRLHFTILLDPDFVLQKKLNATITPEVFLISNSGQTLYRGMIDNWGYEIGKVRPMVTAHYLTDAVNAMLQNKPIIIDSTKAIGCYIE
ncbi:MAG: redoxin domain-containing protein [Chitinophagales bacterium]|nr:redoxin domain-containing protein [Chitinophagales bacterium]